MAHRVVDRLEVVEVDEQHRAVAVAVAHQAVAHQLAEVGAVREPGQPVVGRPVTQLLHGPVEAGEQQGVVVEGDQLPPDDQAGDHDDADRRAVHLGTGRLRKHHEEDDEGDPDHPVRQQAVRPSFDRLMCLAGSHDHLLDPRPEGDQQGRGEADREDVRMIKGLEIARQERRHALDHRGADHRPGRDPAHRRRLHERDLGRRERGDQHERRRDAVVDPVHVAAGDRVEREAPGHHATADQHGGRVEPEDELLAERVQPLREDQAGDDVAAHPDREEDGLHRAAVQRRGAGRDQRLQRLVAVADREARAGEADHRPETAEPGVRELPQPPPADGQRGVERHLHRPVDPCLVERPVVQHEEQGATEQRETHQREQERIPPQPRERRQPQPSPVLS